MLHEVLLALSGHPSPLFEPDHLDDFPLTTPAERSLLKSAGYLGRLHANLRLHLGKIVNDHPSLIARAVANAVLTSHLSAFQKLILEKEREILRRDSASVGAYDIVPLAGVLKSFDGWKRRLEWYWELACVIRPVTKEGEVGAATFDVCTGPLLIKSLRLSSKTGFRDIEEAAISLQQTAERVWLRYLSAWLLSGKLLDHDGSDFFIASKDETPSSTTNDYRIKHDMIPNEFITKEAASATVSIGKLLNFFNNRTGHVPAQQSDATSLATKVKHMHLITAIDTPIKSASLESTIACIRKDFSNRLVREMLPVDEVMKVMERLKDFFLLGRPDFADILVDISQKYLDSRHQQLLRNHTGRAPSSLDLAGIVMRAGELDTVLSRTWTGLAQSLNTNHDFDDDLEWARAHIHLRLAGNLIKDDMKGVRIISPFSDLMLATPAMLTLELDQTLGFFMSTTDLEKYSVLHTYLVALRRGQLRIRTAWRSGPLRGEGLHNASTSHAANRAMVMRQLGASSQAAYVFLSELGAYISEEVISNSWQCFHNWTTDADQEYKVQSSVLGIPLSNHAQGSLDTNNVVGSIASLEIETTDKDGPAEDFQAKDIEALAEAHRRYIEALAVATLVNDAEYCKGLRHVLVLIDQLVAYAEGLQKAQRRLDMHSPKEDSVDGSSEKREVDYIQEEALKTSRGLDDSMQSLIKRLEQLSTVRSGRGGTIDDNGTSFEPWASTGSLERLLLRLQFGLGQLD